MNTGILYESPLWLVGLLFLGILLAALEIGYRIGSRRRAAWKEMRSSGGNLVLTSMLALLGLILAFTYGASVSRYDARKQAVIREGNALGTAFFRASLVAEPERSQLKKALLDYARTRTSREPTTPEEIERIIHDTRRAQAKLWPITERIVRQSQRGPIEALLVAAINEVLDVHADRYAAVLDRLPPVVLWMQVLVAAASLAVAGFNAGVTGRMSRWRMSAFALVLVCVMFVIVDFDRSQDGFIRVSQGSIGNVIQEMEADLGR